MESPPQNKQTSSEKKRIWKIILAILAIIILAIGVYFLYSHISLKEKQSTPSNKAPSSQSKTLSIPQEILNNKFGFLTGEDKKIKIREFGALWARPHPGPFLWDRMQKGKNSQIDFEQTDQLVQNHQRAGVGMLITLWPFADWDQKSRADASNCKVSPEDEFLPKFQKGEDVPYLPQYRCNPNDWDAYQEWLKAVVERYDGDGLNDMPGLEIPIKYWEVMNEPALNNWGEIKDTRLQFYKQKPADYAELLIKSSEVIRQADPEAKILIAGAAGGSDQFLGFYRQVFQNSNIGKFFDIANVHCISNDNYDSFNVEPYKKMLEEFNLDKPIWVTEAETIISDNPNINATQTLNSTKKALDLGAEKIFFTRYDFKLRQMGGMDKPPLISKGLKEIKVEIDGSDPIKAYKIITSQ